MTRRVILGFLTIIPCVDESFVGGLLVLNHLGRPLEFHCSVPVRPNRAQEILFGPTLRPYLFGEQIGCTLIARTKQRPDVIFTDEPNVMQIIHTTDLPVLLLSDRQEADQHRGLEQIGVLKTPAAISAGQTHLRQRVADFMTLVDDEFDLLEPFQRIENAIHEAQQAA